MSLQTEREAIMFPEYLRRDKASAYLQERCGIFTVGTLAKLACIGGGPQFRKLGRFPVYTKADLDSWLSNRLSDKFASTSNRSISQRAA